MPGVFVDRTLEDMPSGRLDTKRLEVAAALQRRHGVPFDLHINTAGI